MEKDDNDDKRSFVIYICEPLSSGKRMAVKAENWVLILSVVTKIDNFRAEIFKQKTITVLLLQKSTFDNLLALFMFLIAQMKSC